MNTLKDDAAVSDWAIVLAGEVLFFGLLGKLLYTNPGEELLAPLLEQDVFSEVPFAANQTNVVRGLELLNQWIVGLDGKLEKGELQEIQSDYTRLFTGVLNVPVAPWESFFFNDEHLLFQEQTMDVRAWYRRYGLEAEKIYKEPDDHIGLELVFLGHLASLGLNAIDNQDETALEDSIQAQKDFLRKHLLVWAPTWCNQMIEHAKTDFYRGLALLVWGAMQDAARIFELEIKEPSPT